MAVVQIIAKAALREGKATSKGRRTYERHFVVVTNDPLDGPVVIWASLGLSPFDVYAGSMIGHDVDAYARLIDIETRQRGDDPHYWDVICQFDSEATQLPQDPLARPPKIYYGFTRYGQVVWQDVAGLPIMNSAGEYYDPPPEADRSRLLIKIARNEIIFNLPLAIAYQDSVNSDPWFGVAPGLARVNITGDPVEENGEEFYAVTYEIEIRWDGWQTVILDQGRYEIPTGGGKPVKILDADDEGVTDPVPLDGAGHVLVGYSPTNAKYRTHNTYRQLPYAALGLP